MGGEAAFVHGELGGRRRKPYRPALVTARLMVLATVLGACAPPGPSEGSWRTHAQRAVSDVSSSLATAALVLRARERDRFVGRYAQVTLVASEETAGKAADGFAAEQPPRSERSRYAAVTDALDQATGLLADVRIAVVDGDPGACPRYCAQLLRLADRLERMETALTQPPETRPR